MDPITILAAFAPALVEAGKAAISRWLAPSEFKPATIEQYLSMRDMDLKMFQAMNAAGGTNASYPWVEACVRLMRPVFAAVVVSTWAIVQLNGYLSGSEIETSTVDNLTAAVGFYLFGDRTLFYAKRAEKR